MSLTRYEHCKATGIPWLGTVPAHWSITKTKYVGGFSVGWTPPTGHADSYEGENLWANISDLGPRELCDTSKRISDAAVVASGIPLSRKGSLLFSFKLSIGQVSFAGADLYTNEAIATFQGSSKLDIRYAYFSYPIFLVQNASTNIYGAKLLNQELIRSASFAIPPLEEQSIIASFLDRETSKIDTLISEQEKLITLLAEKRQATISHAVTKGLNPEAPMKDSGVEWMKKVPQHWQVLTLERVTVDKCDGPFGSGIKSEHYMDEGALVVRLQNIRADEFNRGIPVFLDYQYFMDKLQGHDVKEGDLLVAGLGDDNNLLGRACVAPKGIEPALVKADCFRFRLNTSRVLPSFAAAQLSAGARNDAGRLSSGSTRSRIPLGTMTTRRVALPPLAEQSAIVDFLHREVGRADILTNEATRGISLLKERRSALISAAVTGKIDVRQAAQQEQITIQEAA